MIFIAYLMGYLFIEAHPGTHFLWKTTMVLLTQTIHPSLKKHSMLLLNPLMSSLTRNNLLLLLGISYFFLIQINCIILSNCFPVIIPPKKGGYRIFFSSFHKINHWWCIHSEKKLGDNYPTSHVVFHI